MSEPTILVAGLAPTQRNLAAFEARLDQLGSAAAYLEALNRVGWLDRLTPARRAALIDRVVMTWTRDRPRVYGALADLPMTYDDFDAPDSYRNFIHAVAELSGGKFEPQAVSQSADAQGEPWLQVVSFEHLGIRYEACVEQTDGSFSLAVDELLGQAFLDARIEERLVGLPLPPGGVCFLRPPVFARAVDDGLVPNAQTIEL